MRRGLGLRRAVALLGLVALMLGATAPAAMAYREATLAGVATTTATGWYQGGIHDRGSITDLKADGKCVYAQVKLDLKGYNDITRKHVEVCGKGKSKSWDHTGIFKHWGPILGSYSKNAINGVYIRACVNNRTWPLPDTCSSYVLIGRYGSSSAL